ncbi:MAG: lyase family protein [Gaiellaceae bacterium]
MRPFARIFVPDGLAETLSDRGWLEAMLEAERALVQAEARAGLITEEAAAAVTAALAADRYDIDALAADGRGAGNPVEPLVRAIKKEVGEDHAPDVHRGATSQDILDTAAVLVANRALRLLDAELASAADACARFADEHRASVMAARTLLQQAVPTTFGYKAAGWLVGIVEARARIAAVVLPAQLGGAAGTLAALGADGAKVVRLYAAELDLPEPALPWHTRRGPLAELAGALAAAADAVAKIARDVVLLAQTEVAEVSERDGGASSTMPRKSNPISAVLADACARHARANAALLLDAGVHEHERAVGAWHAEWAALSGALAATGGAAAAIARCLGRLEVDAARMRANLTPDTLAEAERFGLHPAGPEDYLGSVDTFVDRALALHRS